MQKEIKVIAIPNSNQNHSYFKSTYQCQFKENSLISNKHKKKQFSGIQGKYFKMNNYKVTKGIPNITNYISSCYPPVSTGKNGTNEEYLMLKKYLPQFIAETQNYQLNNAHKNENSKFNKNKLNKDERKSYRKRNRSLSEVIYSSLIPDNKNIVRVSIIYLISLDN